MFAFGKLRSFALQNVRLWSPSAEGEIPQRSRARRAWGPAIEVPIQNSIAKRYLILFHRSHPPFWYENPHKSLLAQKKRCPAPERERDSA